MAEPRMIAVDWGTTRLRAWLVDAGGTILDQNSADDGIASVAPGTFPETLRRHVGSWLAKAPGLPVMMAGMVGSRNGWSEVAYAGCPAGAAELAAGMLHFDLGDGSRAAIVPGLASRDAAGLPDVMRGEETKLMGCRVPDGTVVMPGTHSKWARMSGGRIVGFTSYMTGDVFGAVKDHTMAGKLAEAPADDAGFARGLATARAQGGLTHKLFSARTLVLMGELPGPQVGPYLSGLLIGEEVAAGLAAHPDTREVALIADGVFEKAYGQAFAEQGIGVKILAPDEVFIRGLLAIVDAAG
jgi:2-dehydro-3-deoxygalactonokinase